MGSVRDRRPQISPLLNVFEAAEYLQVTPEYLRKVVKFQIPYVQYGERQPLFFHRSDLDLWILRHTEVPAS